MGFPRQKYWSGLPFPPSGDLPEPGIEPESPALAGRFFTTEPPGKPAYLYTLFFFWSVDIFQSIFKNFHKFCFAFLLQIVFNSMMIKVKVESGIVGLKLNIQKTKIMASGPNIHGK